MSEWNVKIKDTKKTLHTLYVIELKINGKTFTIEKRYNDFLNLHQNILDRFPDSKVAVVAKFPQRLLYSTSKDIEERKLMLEVYLEHAFKDDTIRRCAAMKFFLDVRSQEGLNVDEHHESENPNAETIRKFYKAFHNRDAKTMATLYHKDIHFSDPVFPDLEGYQVMAMWKMLTTKAKNLVVEYDSVSADDKNGASCHWEGWYLYGGERPVHNIVYSKFEFKDGKIIKHVDDFAFDVWASQALGIVGTVGGYLIQKGVRKKAYLGLEEYIKENHLGPTSFQNDSHETVEVKTKVEAKISTPFDEEHEEKKEEPKKEETKKEETKKEESKEEVKEEKKDEPEKQPATPFDDL